MKNRNWTVFPRYMHINKNHIIILIVLLLIKEIMLGIGIKKQISFAKKRRCTNGAVGHLLYRQTIAQRKTCSAASQLRIDFYRFIAHSFAMWLRSMSVKLSGNSVKLLAPLKRFAVFAVYYQ